MKKMFSLACLIIWAITGIQSFAYDFVDNGIYYTITSADELTCSVAPNGGKEDCNPLICICEASQVGIKHLNILY